MDLVYIETSIVSHATAWPSSDPATAVLQDCDQPRQGHAETQAGDVQDNELVTPWR